MLILPLGVLVQLLATSRRVLPRADAAADLIIVRANPPTKLFAANDAEPMDADGPSLGVATVTATSSTASKLDASHQSMRAIAMSCARSVRVAAYYYGLTA